MSGALAIFVKTPGFSPVKTRLAATLGAQFACAFHEHAARAIAEIAQAARALDPSLAVYWAVAESAGCEAACWSEFPRLWQGEGELGARLERIYSSLLAHHDRVLMIGVDSPQLTVQLLRDALAALDDTAFALGAAEDGGFWLFGGRVPIAARCWNAVRYSASRTAEDLAAQIAPLGDIARQPTLIDVDLAADLVSLRAALAALAAPLPAQVALLRWLDRVC